MRRIALWFRELNVPLEHCRFKELKSRTVRVYIKASMRIDISMNLPPGRASTNDVIYKMRSRNVVTAALSGKRVAHLPPTREPLPIMLFRQAFCSPAFRITLARWLPGNWWDRHVIINSWIFLAAS